MSWLFEADLIDTFAAPPPDPWTGSPPPIENWSEPTDSHDADIAFWTFIETSPPLPGGGEVTTNSDDVVGDVIVIGERPPVEYPGFDPNPGGGGGETGGGGVGGGADPHRYVTVSQVGDTSCDIDEAWAGLLQNAAPGQTGTAFTGNVVDIPGLGPIIRDVNYETMTVTNITIPGHLLFPGIVTRHIVSFGGAIYIETVGVGAGALGAMNNWLSNPMWSVINSRIAEYVNENDDGEDDC